MKRESMGGIIAILKWNPLTIQCYCECSHWLLFSASFPPDSLPLRREAPLCEGIHPFLWSGGLRTQDQQYLLSFLFRLVVCGQAQRNYHQIEYKNLKWVQRKPEAALSLKWWSSERESPNNWWSTASEKKEHRWMVYTPMIHFSAHSRTQ